MSSYEEKYKRLVDSLFELCDNSISCCQYYLGEEDPQDCMSHCDCSWGFLYHETIRNLIKPLNEGE